MPRKKSTNTEAYNKDFPRRLREVMQEKGETQQIVGDAIGKTRQAVGYYADGSSSPDWETIVKIAKHFGVSTDYLLGLTDQPTLNTEIRAICDYTGLSERSIQELNYCKSVFKEHVTNIIADLIDAILRSVLIRHFYRLAWKSAITHVSEQRVHSSNCFDFRAEEQKVNDELWASAHDFGLTEENQFAKIPHADASRFYRKEATLRIERIADRVVREYSEKVAEALSEKQ